MVGQSESEPAFFCSEAFRNSRQPCPKDMQGSRYPVCKMNKKIFSSFYAHLAPFWAMCSLLYFQGLIPRPHIYNRFAPASDQIIFGFESQFLPD